MAPTHQQEIINPQAVADATSGEYEKHFVIVPGCVVVDLGAHAGHFSEWAANKGAFVIAFEPHPENFKWLNERLKGRSAVAVNKAATAFDGVAVLYECPENSGAHSLFKHAQCSDVQHTVGCIDIGKYLKGMKLKPDFIKIDTEGSEYNILHSLFRARIKTSMAIECHSEELYLACRRLAWDEQMTWLPETPHVGVCYCLP